MLHLIMVREAADRERGKPYIEAGAALAAQLLLRAVKTIGWGLHFPGGSRSFATLSKDITTSIRRLGGAKEARDACTVQVQALLDKLKEWVDDASLPAESLPAAQPPSGGHAAL